MILVRGSARIGNGYTHVDRSHPSVLDYEWVDDAANSLNNGKQVGYGFNGMNAELGFGCERGFSVPPNTLTRFRCCMTR